MNPADSNFTVIKQISLIFLIWVLTINIFALFVGNRLNVMTDSAYWWSGYQTAVDNHTWDLTSYHARWDSEWYLDIAENGYAFLGPEKLSNVVFFPLYPGLMWLASFLFSGNFALAGWILSLIFLFLALCYFYKLIKEFHSEIQPIVPIIFLLIFPTSFFLNAVYTEALFMFLSIASFYYARKNNFLAAGIFGLLASLTRVTGLLLFVPLLWEYFANNGIKSFSLKRFLPIILVPLGTAGFFLFHYIRYGDFLLFLKIQAWWGRSFELNKDHFQTLTHPATVNLITDSLFVIFAVVTMYVAFRRIRASYGLYMLVTLIVALSTGTFMSIGRYILVLFPMYIVIASTKNQYIHKAYSFASILFLAMYTMLFVTGYWAG